MSSKTVSMSTVSSTMANAFAPLLIELTENFLSTFSMEVITQCGISEEKLVEVFNKTCPNLKGINLEVIIDKTKRKQKAEETRIQKIQESPKCYRENCEKPSKNKHENMYFCVKHYKQIVSKHCCVYIKKNETQCGSRVKKEQEPLNSVGNQYHNQYLCATHIKIINKTIEREAMRCIHTTKNGKQCVSMRVDGSDVCKKHNKDENAKIENNNKYNTIKNKNKEEEKLPDVVINNPNNFILRNRKPVNDLDFIHRKVDSGVIFIDMNSGLVCENPNNKSSTKPDNNSLVAIGEWDNEKQTYTELTDQAQVYAKAHKLGVGKSQTN